MRQVSTAARPWGQELCPFPALHLVARPWGCIALHRRGWAHTGTAPCSLHLCLPCATHSHLLPVPRCQPGWFNLQPHNPMGCTSCFCYGHSSACRAAEGFEEIRIRSDFSRGNDPPPAPGGTEGTALPISAKKTLGRMRLGVPLWG